MKNPATVLLAIAVGILGLFAYSQTVALRLQRRQLQELTVKLDTVPKNATLDLQGRCAKQAREFLSQFENRDVIETLNHYNVKLNKCFVETRSVSFSFGSHSVSEILTDAFEGKNYGEYTFVSTPNKADYLGSPVTCKVTLLSGEETICHSSDEFDALVKQYME